MTRIALRPGWKTENALMEDEPQKPRRKWPVLLAVLLGFIGLWHYFCQNHLESELNRIVGNYVREHLRDSTVAVDVQPLTNLVEIQITRNVRGADAPLAFLGDAIIESVRQALEPALERKIGASARADVDLYAMLVSYQVAISIDKVRVPKAARARIPPPSRMVQEIQRQLVAKGYEPGPADGRLGDQTRNAIQGFQRDHGLAEDGRPTGELLAAIRGQ